MKKKDVMTTPTSKGDQRPMLLTIVILHP